MKENYNRRKFLKTIGKAAFGTTTSMLIPDKVLSMSEQLSRHTEFKKTDQKFKNGEYVWDVESDKQKVGEFWPIHGINLVTKDTDPLVFAGGDLSVQEMQNVLGDKNIVATAPDGMTTGSFSNRKLEGKCLSNGRSCGDGEVKNYGVLLIKKGFDITFTHKREIPDFDAFYKEAKEEKDTIIFLPSIYRNGATIDARNLIDKVLIRRETPNGQQIGIVLFDKSVSGNEAREIILGLDREDKNSGDIISNTTHIYVLDGGPIWGQSAKEVYDNSDKSFQNPRFITKGTRNPDEVTNYLVFY